MMCLHAIFACLQQALVSVSVVFEKQTLDLCEGKPSCNCISSLSPTHPAIV